MTAGDFGGVAMLWEDLWFGVRQPDQPILGTELAGVVETAGKDVTLLSPGDAILAFPGGKMGCHAQYCVHCRRRSVGAQTGKHGVRCS